MRQFSLLGLAILLLCNASLLLAQDEPAPAAAAADGSEDAAAPAAGGEEAAEGSGDKEEECEEAWNYVEFMKKDIKEKIEMILQETLFQPRPLLEETVTKAMEEVLEIRDSILTRTKSIRTEDGEVLICPEQNINQEEFLTQTRMQVMTILLSLIERDAATSEKLQDIGKQLLAIRTKVNGEITRMIMLRETSGTVRKGNTDDCDCGILGDVVEGMDNVIDGGHKKDGEEGAKEGADVSENVVEADEPAPAAGEEGGDDAMMMGDDPVQALTMVLMTVDSEIKALYNEILGELDDEARTKLSDELQELKSISTDLHEALSKLSELDPESDKDAVERLIRRDVRSIRNDAKRLLDNCQQLCPGECDSCGAEKIDEVSDKLNDYKASLEDLGEEEAKESIRADLMAYLTQTNSDMTELLKKKAGEGKLDDCGSEQLEVIEKIKGPLWMMVNITIFGDAATMTEMVTALEQALTEMRANYCGPSDDTVVEPKSDSDECDLNEINAARDWITDIDTIIAEDIFKSEDEDGRRKAMLGLIDMKSSMDDRVRELFQDNLRCKEEVEQIKNIYAQKITECLAEMMNPRFRFDLLGRSERVQCVKDLRILMEGRRGVLLMREIEARISQSGVQSVGDKQQGA